MANARQEKETPLMKQYNAIKSRYPDALLLFRVGDFYETFGEDAIKVSKILGIVLTKRANGAASFVDLAGFPHHSLDTYLPKLVKAGYRVAICDQLEDPKLAKSIVKRGVTELVTPGMSFNDHLLENKSNNFLAALHFGAKTGVSFLDVSTGEFYTGEGHPEYIDNLLQSFKPNEVVLQKSKLQEFRKIFGDRYYTYTFEDWVFSYDFCYEMLLNHFGTSSLKGFGIEGMPFAIISAGAALHYMMETHHEKSAHINRVSRLDEEDYVWLDRFTIRNLELVSTPNEHAGTLLEILDHTVSPMGARLLKKWILLPLRKISSIENRLEIVDFFLKNNELSQLLTKDIRVMGDLERLISKVAVKKCNPREVIQIKRALESIRKIKLAIENCRSDSLKKAAEKLNPCELIRSQIERQIEEDPPVNVLKGNVIREGFSQDLDELRNLMRTGKDYLVRIQQREMDKTGIGSLKIGYNNVFGYYLEVTNAHKSKVPQEWHRKQTLTGSERYITDELKEYEEKILGAEEKISALEANFFDKLVDDIAEYIEPVQLNAQVAGFLDVLLSFADTAKENNYSKPVLSQSYKIAIREGRHPVIEKYLSAGESYVSNNIDLDNENQQIIILTGPNMSGKSALLRQTAMIVLMAQIGSYVPAASAEIGVVDKIFTRVGASDNISSGESTFMVEMNETASILNNISNRCLVLLDEIGRGTSTYDGISIAWSIAEYLHEHPAFRAKVLFATHYHELNDMAQRFKRIRNYHISIREVGNKIIFLRKLVSGGSEHSFGIHVARMAGMPEKVISRAGDILQFLEDSHSNTEFREKTKRLLLRDGAGTQLSFIQLEDPLLDRIREELHGVDVNTMTPVEALLKLNEIKKMLG
ncbi:MAG: DNA mismatch repair protein MutS [Bacteroidales bacterium]|nr:DNA mismatch repair protein MutS [Bacteroidales bacterium]